MTELLEAETEQRLLACKRVWIGFSGGLDSAVLLHVLMQKPLLATKLQVIHVNHGISPYADAWEAAARTLCEQLSIPFVSKKIKLLSEANLEEEARKCRYEVFRSVVASGEALVLAHHKDDQAETLLLQLFRGAGLRGMAAMQGNKAFGPATILRPLLQSSRKALEAYASHHQLSYVFDESNEDCSYSRNFLRHQIIPKVQKRWPGVQSNLARTAAHCLEAEGLLDDLAEIDYPGLLTGTEPLATLSIVKLSGLSTSRIKNVMQKWLRSHEIRLPSTAVFNRLLSEVIPANADKCPEISWGGIYGIRRYQESLYLLLLKDLEEKSYPKLNWENFPGPLQLPGKLGYLRVEPGGENYNQLQDTSIHVAFRKGGEEIILHGQTKSLKKLFQQWQIPPWLRGSIPLIFIGSQLAAVVGYAISDPFKLMVDKLTLCRGEETYCS